MAVGDPYFYCEENQGLEQAFRDMIYNDGLGNPVININPNGSLLEPYFNCGNNQLTYEELLRMLIVKDANGNPVFNIATL